MHTQSSSKPRLKNDTLGNAALQRLYSSFDVLDINEFKVIAIECVQTGGGKQARKDEIIKSIRATPRKDVALSKAQNFILAGMGLGV